MLEIKMTQNNRKKEHTTRAEQEKKTTNFFVFQNITYFGAQHYIH